MTIVSKIRRGSLYLGEDKSIVVQMDLQAGDDMTTWELEFVIRDLVATCRDPRDDPGTGTLRLTVENAAIQVNNTDATITVPINGTDTASLDPADYFAGLNRVDAGNRRPLAIFAPLHFSPWPQDD